MDKSRNPKTWVGQPLLLLAMALVLSACSGSGGGGGGTTSNTGNTSNSAPTSRNVTAATPVSATSEADRFVLQVQPIQVCDDDGLVCAQVELFETIADKIWQQADIDIAFLPVNQLNDSTYLTTDEDEFFDMSFSGGAGSFGRHPDSSRDQGPINLWFVDTIEAANGLVQFGNAWIGVNGVLISDDILDFNNGIGRIDVIAHEIGHNLGLRHSNLGAGAANNLLTSGGRRTIPESIDDIVPDGAGLSQLNSQQIERAQSSNFVTQLSSDQIVTAFAPVTEADAIPWTVAEADAVPLLTNDSAVEPASHAIPENSPSALTWLLLLFLGQPLYRRLRHG